MNHTKQQTSLYEFLFSVFVLVVLVVTGCADKHAQLTPLDSDAVIVAFGDSLTEGTGAQEFQSYPAVLAKLSGRQVINAGVAGEISKVGLARLPSVLATHKPKLVLLCHGGNDLLRKLNQKQLQKNLEQMIEQITDSGAQVILIGVPKPSLLLGPAPIYKEITAGHKLVANLQIFSQVLSKAGLKSDPVHPNAAGYKKVAEAIHTTLSEAGAY